MLVHKSAQPRKAKQMDYPALSEYIKALVEGKGVERVAYEAQVSRATIYNIMAGKRARPENYQRIALAVGTNKNEQREIYKQLMQLSGYLSLLPADENAIDNELTALILAEIERQFPDVLRAAKAIVEARASLEGAKKRAEIPKDTKGNHREE